MTYTIKISFSRPSQPRPATHNRYSHPASGLTTLVSAKGNTYLRGTITEGVVRGQDLHGIAVNLLSSGLPTGQFEELHRAVGQVFEGTNNPFVEVTVTCTGARVTPGRDDLADTTVFLDKPVVIEVGEGSNPLALEQMAASGLLDAAREAQVARAIQARTEAQAAREQEVALAAASAIAARIEAQNQAAQEREAQAVSSITVR